MERQSVTGSRIKRTNVKEQIRTSQITRAEGSEEEREWLGSGGWREENTQGV